MREQMTKPQLEFLNRTFAATVRRLTSIKKKMDASKLPQDDAVFAAVSAAVQSLYVVCEVTHERLEAMRPKPEVKTKPSAMTVQRWKRHGQEAAVRSAVERGRAEPPKPIALPGDDLPY